MFDVDGVPAAFPEEMGSDVALRRSSSLMGSKRTNNTNLLICSDANNSFVVSNVDLHSGSAKCVKLGNARRSVMRSVPPLTTEVNRSRCTLVK